MNEELDYEYEYDEHGEIVYYAVRPNKTKIKKEIATLFTLGEEMAALSLTHIKSLELPENINKAVIEVSRMPHTGARKRLLKYIAGQLHKIETESFIEKVARIKNTSAHAVRELHIAEHWRDRLIAGGNDALTEFLHEYDYADRQQLRQLVRNAQKEAELAKPPKSSRLLFRYLKELLQNETEEALALSADVEEDDEQDFDDEEGEFDNEFDEDDEFDEFDEDDDED
jgi:ribosome-associated protein